MLANLQLDIDCDRETERIFSLLSSNSTKLQDMEGECQLIEHTTLQTSHVNLITSVTNHPDYMG